MDGFDKIELEKSSVKSPVREEREQIVAVKRSKRFKNKKRIFTILGILGVFLLFSILFIALPAWKTYKSAKHTYAQVRVLSQALKQQNIAVASEEIEKTKVSLVDTQKQLHSLFFMKYVPIVGWYYNDADHMMNAGNEGLAAGTIVVEALKPYADVLGLKGENSFVGGSAEERIKTAVLTMGKITPKIDEISEHLDVVNAEIEKIDPNHYPEFLFGKKVKTQLTQVRELTDQGVTFVDEARPLVKVLPSLLGEKEEKKYLVLFQNDKELRPTGGFITAYAVFRVDKGVIKVERSDDIYKLDDSVPNKPKAPAPLVNYLEVRTFNLRDSNLSPDFINSMDTFREMYDRATQGVDVDGIIAIDTQVLVDTIKILDDSVTAGGITFNTKNDDRCDCPQVIYLLEDNISRPVNYIKEDRKGLIGDLMFSIMGKALSSSPKIYWGPLVQSGIKNINQKHIMFYLFDKDAQSGIEALNAAGRIKTFDGDYLHINDTNFAGAKANLFVSQEVEIAYDIKNDGAITKTITIDYKNPYPPSDCNLERGGLCLNAEMRDWLRVYVPKGSKLVKNEGSEVKMSTYEELGKTVFEGYMTVRPKGAKKYTITYELPFKLSKGSNLPVLIQKQPGTNGNQYTIKVNGKTKEKFQLFADKELELKI
jgi:hypothetical protein